MNTTEGYPVAAMAKFNSVLVANRGEIALRVIRTARRLGYRTIAVYSEADSHAPHVKAADEAYLIGPAPAAASYLSFENILQAASASGAEAIHPGYGFLSENAEFAQRCSEAGLVFIGPAAGAIELMGNKAAAKKEMLAAGVPCVPGHQGEQPDDSELLEAAKNIGFPLMVKAAAGGGGRGMSLVESAAGLASALRSARSVALNSFGSDELILEKAVLQARHVEVQVFGDSHGNVVHLGERDCSSQRRHQKVIEEAPCPAMKESLRAAMGAAAVAAASSINYCGAGTVEFLLDQQDQFYFLEMNTRLQVEHPVTELVTGLDLVELQLRVAQGEPLGFTQEALKLSGHAIEVRLYAEDPMKNFMPRTGQVQLWKVPDNARVDAGIETGYEVTPYYDSMLAKIICHGDNRESARQQLLLALKNTALFGIASNRDFLIKLLAHPTFIAGAATTTFVEEANAAGELQLDPVEFHQAAVAAILLHALDRTQASAASVKVAKQLLDWSSAEPLICHYHFENFQLQLAANASGLFRVSHGSNETTGAVLDMDADSATIQCGNRRERVLFHVPDPGLLQLSINGSSFEFRNALAFPPTNTAAHGQGSLSAPMHGVVQEVMIAAGDTVKVGQRLLVVEAMKMQHDIVADSDGVIDEVLVCAGDQVATDDLLVVIN